ncbi:tRNA1(Val) (adenine(37)-N6)-methyltransferase, partial [uncultured Duncaniella sp.]
MSIFRFKQFTVDDSRCGMKIGTDGVLLGSWAHADGAGCIIDAGTGSGLIALMMAQRYPKTHVTGIDIDEPATLDAMHNVSLSPWSGRIDIINTDLLNWSPGNHIPEIEHPICIVSNPPFFTEALHSPDAARS